MKRRSFLATSGAFALLPLAARAGFVDYTPGMIDAALKDGKTVFVDYSATWCSTCKRQERVIAELSLCRCDDFRKSGLGHLCQGRSDHLARDSAPLDAAGAEGQSGTGPDRGRHLRGPNQKADGYRTLTPNHLARPIAAPVAPQTRGPAPQSRRGPPIPRPAAPRSFRGADGPA